MRTDNYWLNSPTTNSNRFEILDSEEEEESGRAAKIHRAVES
jgi:hypothetical protein